LNSLIGSSEGIAGADADCGAGPGRGALGICGRVVGAVLMVGSFCVLEGSGHSALSDLKDSDVYRLVTHAR
jgi:hypothetical protein